MKRVLLLALPLAVVFSAIAWPIARGGVGGVCEHMTPARMLEEPGIASEYAEALRSGDAAEVARVRALIEEIRALHGCEGAEVAGDADGASVLPPGHPPVDGDSPHRPVFEAPATISI